MPLKFQNDFFIEIMFIINYLSAGSRENVIFQKSTFSDRLEMFFF
jgi:hypothetical protein